MALVINRDIDYTGIDKRIGEGYGSGYLAARNLEDSVKHELAHVMTFQGCNTYEEYQALKEKYRSYRAFQDMLINVKMERNRWQKLL